MVNGTTLFAGTLGGGVFRSTNNGTIWTEVNSGLPPGPARGVSSFAASGTNIFAGTGAGVFLSTNSGTDWTSASTGLTGPTVWSFAVSGANLFAGTQSGGVFLSTNNGTNWIAMNTGLSSPTIRTLAVSGSTLFAGTYDSGVFRTTNNGTGWSAVNTGMTSDAVFSFAMSGVHLFVGTGGKGVWRRPISELTSVRHVLGEVPTRFGLDQNYPNPFNPSTSISFSIPSQSFVSLKIFDASGREVSVLVAEELSAGLYSQQWNASGYASGVYFCRLEAGVFMETKKLVLLR
jgi:hypothetical protein